MILRPIDWQKDRELVLLGEIDYLINVDPKFDNETARRVALDRVKALSGRESVCGVLLESADGDSVGYILYEKKELGAGEKLLNLMGIWVRPTARNHGHATTLLQHLLATATDLGAHQVTTFVHPDNLASLQLYEKLGFVQTNIEMVKPIQ